jgi:serine/threonine protein phosphatase 1
VGLIYAVGDIHGEAEKLGQLLAILPLEPEDQLVFLGDFIDRGPESYQVVEMLLRVREARPDTVFLRGNHEQMLLDTRAALNGVDREQYFSKLAMWTGNGGSETIASYPPGRWWEAIPQAHWEFFDSTLMEYRVDDYLFVHAGVLPKHARWDDGRYDPRLWIREPFLSSGEDFGVRVVFGHTPQESHKPLVRPNKIGIDTGAAFGGPLTAVAVKPGSDEEPGFYQCPIP